MGVGGYERNSVTNVAHTSSYTPSNGFNGAFTDFYSSGLGYGDTTWSSSSAKRDGFGPFGYGLDSATSNVSAKTPPWYVGGYSVNKRESNIGKY